MVKYIKCNICDSYGFSDRNKYPPKWEARYLGTNYYMDDDLIEFDWTSEFYANDEEQAAEMAAENWESREPYLLLDESNFLIIEVRKCDEPEKTYKFKVFGQVVPIFSVNKYTES